MKPERPSDMKRCKCGNMFPQYRSYDKLCVPCRIKKNENRIHRGIGAPKETGRKYGPIEETARHKEEAQVLIAIKSDKIKKLGSMCESCGKKGSVTLSHFIPGSKGSKYKLDPEASCLMDLQCHYNYEHLIYKEIAKFRNIDTILDFLRDRNPLRHDKITEGILRYRMS